MKAIFIGVKFAYTLPGVLNSNTEKCCLGFLIRDCLSCELNYDDISHLYSFSPSSTI